MKFEIEHEHGEPLPPENQPLDDAPVFSSGNLFAGLLIVLGTVGVVFFFLVFKVAPDDKIVNLDLLQQRQNGIIISSVITVLGTLIILRRRD